MKVNVLSSTEFPQTLIWQAMHQCYSTNPVYDVCSKSEREYGELVVKHLLKGGRGHWSPLEQAHMSLNLTEVPLPIVVQFERHRLFSYSEQSLRYTAIDSGADSIYTRPEGAYKSRDGKTYVVDESRRSQRLQMIEQLLDFYNKEIEDGVAEEDARFLLPLGVKKNLVMGGNLRAWLHLMDMRLKANAQLEAQQLADLIHDKLVDWVPEIMYYYDNEHKTRLMP